MKRLALSIRGFVQPIKLTKRADTNLAVKQVLGARKISGLPSRAQLSHLPKLLSQKEKQIAIIGVILIIFAGALLVRELINSKRIVMPAVGGEYTEGLIGMPQMINPIYSMTNDVDADISRLVYSGLMKFDTKDGLVPDLAESYTISEDGKKYTFVLRDNATWQDSKKVLANDIIFTISAIQNPDYRSPLEISFSGVTLEQIDDRTVTFTLNEPFAPFLSFLTVGILPSHLWQQIAPQNATLAELNRKPVGSGPYMFEKLIRDSSGTIRTYTLERFDDYYDGAPYLKTINFKFFTDINGAVDALNNHNIEGLSYVPTDDLPFFEKDGSVTIHASYMHQYSALFFNQKQQPILKNDDVRLALTKAIDKQEILNNALGGNGKIIESFILNSMLGYSADIPAYAFDLEAAKTLLENAGWIYVPIAEDIADQTLPTIRSKDDTNLVLELVTLNSTELIKTAETIKDQWLKLGVQVNITSVSPATFQSDILKNRKYDILLSGERYGIDSDPYAFWHSSQVDFPGLNLAQFSDSDADKYIIRGRNSLNNAVREEAYIALQKIVSDELPAVFLFQPVYSYATSSAIQGIDVEELISPSDRFSRINEWHIKTKKIFKQADREEKQTACILSPSAT